MSFNGNYSPPPQHLGTNYSPVGGVGGEYVSDNTPPGGAASLMFTEVMKWLTLALAVMVVSMIFIGPFIPPAVGMVLSLVMVAFLLITAFTRLPQKYPVPMLFVVAAVIGIMMYSLVMSFISRGATGVVTMALLGTFIIAGGTTMVGLKAKKNYSHLYVPLFFGLLAVIVISLLNTFIFHLSALSLIVAIVSLGIFSVYMVLDVQRIKKDSERGTYRHPASYALDIFLNVVNIFTSLLRILSSFAR